MDATQTGKSHCERLLNYYCKHLMKVNKSLHKQEKSELKIFWKCIAVKMFVEQKTVKPLLPASDITPLEMPAKKCQSFSLKVKSWAGGVTWCIAAAWHLWSSRSHPQHHKTEQTNEQKNAVIRVLTQVVGPWWAWLCVVHSCCHIWVVFQIVFLYIFLRVFPCTLVTSVSPLFSWMKVRIYISNYIVLCYLSFIFAYLHK